MAEVTSYRTGQPCWADVTSPDLNAAAAFYSELFGWEAAKDPRPEAGGYTMFTRDGKSVAAASPPQGGGAPNWIVYLAADDVATIAARIRDAGGNVLMEPFDVFDAGRMTVAADPASARFGVWQAGTHIGSQLSGEPGTINWAEVQTRDHTAAQSFYERVFGYEQIGCCGHGGQSMEERDTTVHLSSCAAQGNFRPQQEKAVAELAHFAWKSFPVAN